MILHEAERAPLCFIVEEEPSVRHFLSLILHGSGLDTEEFADGARMREVAAKRKPDLVFIDIPLDSTDAAETVDSLGRQGFFGFIQLMSNRGAAVLEHVKSIGEQHRLNMLPVLKKPFDTNAILKILQSLKLTLASTAVQRINLNEALARNWIEFWYQPKIDLSRKRLAGAEAFVRARHPQHGYLSPNSFIPNATDSAILALSELALSSVLKTGQKLAKIGVNLPLSVNMQIDALKKIQVANIVHADRPDTENWPGVVIDVAEDQIIKDLPLAVEIAKTLTPLNVRVAIDNFGHGYESLMRLRTSPFAELKLDRAFVGDCYSDRRKAPLCKNVIELAHRFGGVATGIGIEKASDASVLHSLGCNYGQGFLFGQPMPEARFLSLLQQRVQERMHA